MKSKTKYLVGWILCLCICVSGLGFLIISPLIPIEIIEERDEEDMTKRFGTTKTDHEVEPVHFLQNCKSGSNYIYAYNDAGTLTIKTHTSNDDIITNGTTRFTDANLQDHTIPCVMRVLGSRVHIVYINDDTSPKLKYGYSDDDGVNWTWDEAVGGEAGYDDFGADDNVIDIGVVDSVIYTLTYDNSAHPRIYELTTFTRLWIAPGGADTGFVGIGYIENDVFYFPFQTTLLL